MSVVFLENVSVFYRGGNSLFRSSRHHALKDISVSLSEGENVGVIGSNGSGKTTLLKVIAGIIRPDQGSCVYKKGLRRSFLGLQTGFVGTMTGLENIKLTAMLLGMKRGEVKRVVGNIIEYSELGDRINDMVLGYSAGMKARLAFSISLHVQPDLLLIDEMMGVGDKDFRKKSLSSMKDLVNSNVACVIVSHELNYMKNVCKNVLWIDNGCVVDYGEASAVLKRYLI